VEGNIIVAEWRRDHSGGIPMTYGVTEDGFVIKTYEVILEEKKDRAKALFGGDIDLTETSPLLKLLEVQALEEQRLWEMAESYYYSGYIDYATGISLDRVAALLGATRKAATPSVGTITFTGVNGTIIPIGTVVQTTGDNIIQFTTDAAVTIAGGTASVGITADIPGEDGNVAGSTITTLQTPIVGVVTVNNASATTGGSDVETDSEFRARCKGTLTALGKGTLEAIRVAVLAVSGVESVSAYEDLDIHVVNLYVVGVTAPNTDVDDAIEDTRPAGIPVFWYPVTNQNIYVDCTVKVDAAKVPVDAATQIAAKIEEYIESLGAGDDVIYYKVIDAIWDSEEDETEAWIKDIEICKTGTTPSPAGTTNISIDVDKKAVPATINVTLDAV